MNNNATKQGIQAPVNVYTISGYSDDIVTIDGPGLGSGLEFDNTAGHFLITVKDEEGNQCLVNVQLGFNSQWMIGVQPIDDDAPLPIGKYELSASGYSAILTISTPHTFSFECGDE